jgi:hypothetical protein
MRMAMIAAALATVGLLGVARSTAVLATDIDSYRWDHDRPNCRVIETRSTNRWGEDVTIRRRVCG